MQVFLESLKVVPEWLVQQIYLYSNTALVVLSAFVLLVAGLTVFQCRRAWKSYSSKKNLLKELSEHFPPLQGS